MLKRFFLLFIVLIVLSLQFIQRGWFAIGNQLLGLFEEAQVQHLLREIVQGRNSVVMFYLGVILVGLLSKVFVVEVRKYSSERCESLGY